VTWLGRSSYSANDLLVLAGQRPKPRDQAADFLEHFLADGPRTSQEVWKAAKKAGVSWRTLERAKKPLDVRSRRVHAEHYDGYEIDSVLRELRRQGVPPTRLLDEEEEDER
jgi:hypothetical protein